MPTLSVAGYRFSPSLSVTIIVAVALTILIFLGNWQIDRAGEKEAIQALYDARRQMPPVGLAEINKLGEQETYRKAALSGHYLHGYDSLLDNRTYLGRAGYYVLSLFRPQGSQNVMWVNRGWVQAGRLRSELPNIETPALPLEITGELRLPPAKGVYLGDVIHYEKWPKVIQYVDNDLASRISGSEILPLMIYLEPDEGTGYVRQWPLLSVQPERHLGYAVQWYGMALVLCLIFVLSNTRRIS